MTAIYASLDIAKLNLQPHLAGCFHDLPKTASGHRGLLKLLAARVAVQVVCEATGGYGREVVSTMPQAGLPVSVLHLARVRHLAHAQGQRAKTDRTDACVFSAYGQALQPKATPSPTAI